MLFKPRDDDTAKIWISLMDLSQIGRHIYFHE